MRASCNRFQRTCRLEDLLMMDMTSEDVVGLTESNSEGDETKSEFSGGQ